MRSSSKQSSAILSSQRTSRCSAEVRQARLSTESTAGCCSVTVIQTHQVVLLHLAACIPMVQQHPKLWLLLLSSCCYVVVCRHYRRGTCFAELNAVVEPCSSSFSLTSSTPAAGFKPVSKNPLGAAAAAGSRRPTAAVGGPRTDAAGLAGAGGSGLFDPTIPGAVLVNGVQWQQGKGVVKGRPVVPVVSASIPANDKPILSVGSTSSGESIHLQHPLLPIMVPAHKHSLQALLTACYCPVLGKKPGRCRQE